MKKTVIAIVGAIGAGKNTLADYLVDEKGFAHRYDTDILEDELKRRQVPVIRENLRNLANEIRSRGETILMSDQLFIEMSKTAPKLVVGFFRAVMEIEKLKEFFPEAIIIGIDAPVELRYERAVLRNHEKDRITFERFVELQEADMRSKDPAMQNVAACLERADYMIINDSSEENLHKQMDEILEKIERVG